MKNCPSCSVRVEEEHQVCPSCGYHFPREETAAQKTMMGLPAIVMPISEEGVEDEPDDSNQTLFGFPAQKRPTAPPIEELSEPSDGEFEDDATHLIPAAQLQAEFGGDSNPLALVNARAPKPPNATIESAWGLNEESEESSTERVSTSIVHASKLLTPETAGGAAFATQNVHDEDFPNHGTLMGMSLNELVPTGKPPEPEPDPEPGTNSRSTQFAIAAVVMDDSDEISDSASLDESSISDEDLDVPTAMWNPADELGPNASDQQREMLEQIRKGSDGDVRGSTAQNKAAPKLAKSSSPTPEAGAVPAGIRSRDILRTTPKLQGLPDPSTLRARLQAKLNAKNPESPAQNLSGILNGHGMISNPFEATPDPGEFQEQVESAPDIEIPATPHVPLEEADTGPTSPKVPVTLDIILDPVTELSPDPSADDDFAYANTGIAPLARPPEPVLAPPETTPEASFPALAEMETSPLSPSADFITPAAPGLNREGQTTTPDLSAPDMGRPLGSPSAPLTQPAEPAFAADQLPAPGVLQPPLATIDTVSKAQTTGALIAGGLMLVGGVFGLISGAGFLSIAAMAITMLSGMALGALAILPIPAQLKPLGFTFLGGTQVLLGIITVVLSVVPAIPGAIIAASGLLAIFSALFPLFSKT